MPEAAMMRAGEPGKKAKDDGTVAAIALWPGWAAPLLNAVALLLALGFRRNRAVVVLVVLLFSSLGIVLATADARGTEAIRMFAPWLLLAAAALPERNPLARRNLVLLLLLLIAIWLTFDAPDHVWTSLRGALPFGMLHFSTGALAAALTFFAASLCVLRWVLIGAPMEAGLAIVLGLAAFALLPNMRNDGSSMALAFAGVCALFAVLYASYRMAFMDALSGLPNRRALDETLAQLSGDYAIAMVDVDHFKSFNDTHGHAAGDRVLQAVAQALRRERRGRAFRYGGEEFCLLFTGSRHREAAAMCDETRARIEAMRVRVRSAPTKGKRAHGERGDTEVKVTASIGVAFRDEQARFASDVIKAADQALYKAKAKGRNRVVAR
jgi:diguanylate cyclase (GGDEF)-like protein